MVVAMVELKAVLKGNERVEEKAVWLVAEMAD